MKLSWEVKKLGEVASFSQGIQVGLEQHLSEPKEGYVRFIRIVDYTQNTDDKRYVPNPGEKYFVNEDDLVMVRYGTPGLIGRGKAGVIANNLFQIKIERKDLTNDYLSLFLSQDVIQNYLSTQGSATMPALNFGQLKTVEVSFPPLQEQQRIVSILDEAFTAIDKAKANTEQNLKNVKELFESELQRVFSEKGDGWEEKSLGEVIEIRNGKNQSSVISESGKYKIMGSAGNVMGFATDYICEEGTTIIGRKGNISKPLYIEEKFWNVDTAFGLYPKNNLNKKLVYYMCLTIDFASMNRGTTIPSLVKSELLKINIFIPTEKEQQKIVSKLDVLREQTKKLEAVYTQKLQDLEELKKSVLQKAFSGEL